MFARRRESQAVEMQLGPMIDMVFLLLVFFMVTAKPIQPESDVSISLPGTVSADEAPELPEELQVVINPDGVALVNDLAVDRARSREMPELVRLLKRFKESADAARVQALVTIRAEDGAEHQRIIDVLNACAEAGVRGVTFSPGDSEES